MTDSPLVSVAGLMVAFDGSVVLDGIAFDVPAGSVTTLIGPSGSGKTTALRSLDTLQIPDAGTVRIGETTVDFGASPTRSQLAALRARSAMVFQANNLFPHLTVLRNITEAPIVAQGRPADEVRSEALALLEQVGLRDLADRHPAQLSGGQQQRVGIARALAVHPELLLFDEPTSALDPETVGEVLGVMRDLASQGRTMIVVTHEIRFAQQVADQVLFLDGGAIVERGAPADVLVQPKEERTRQFLARILDPL